MNRLQRLALRLTALSGLALLALPANAQQADYPQRPITLVVPFPAGGPSDALARGFVQLMGARWGQSVVVENVGGAGGTIGLHRVARSAAAVTAPIERGLREDVPALQAKQEFLD